MASDAASQGWWQRLLAAIQRLLGRAPAESAPTPSALPKLPSQTLGVGEERRAHMRVPIELRVAVRFGSIEGVLDSHTVDLSHAGVFISTTSPRSVGTRVRVQFTVADEVVDLTGVVVRRISPAEAVGTPPGMGVRFEGLSPDAQALVDRIVAHPSWSGVRAISLSR